MKSRFVLIISASIFVLFSGCSTTDLSVIDQTFIDALVSELAIAKTLASVVPAKAKLILKKSHQGTGLTALIADYTEGAFTQYLLDEGYSVLERDPKILDQFLQEKANDTYSVFYEESSLMDRIQSIPVNPLKADDLLDPKMKAILEKDRNSIYLTPTHFESADYVVSIRLLDIKVTYKPEPKPWLISLYDHSLGLFNDLIDTAFQVKSKIHTLQREGTVRVHVQVADPASGKILMSRSIQGQYSDSFQTPNPENYQNIHFYQLANTPPPYKTNGKNSISIDSFLGPIDLETNFFVGYKFYDLLSDHGITVGQESTGSFWLEFALDSYLNNKLATGHIGYPFHPIPSLKVIPYAGALYDSGIKFTYGARLVYVFSEQIAFQMTFLNNDPSDLLSLKSTLSGRYYLE